MAFSRLKREGILNPGFECIGHIGLNLSRSCWRWDQNRKLWVTSRGRGLQNVLPGLRSH